MSVSRHRSNDIVSGLLHLFGAGLAIGVMVVLIVLGASRDAWHVVGFTLYGVGLILLYTASASYHLVPDRFVRIKRWTQRFDHAMIYVLIAATYTPVTFIALSGGWRWSIFGVVWGIAVVGVILKLCAMRVSGAVSSLIYLSMGWLIVIAIRPLMANMGAAELWLLAAGGLAYTLGVVFFELENHVPQRKYFWMHEIFHVFVLAGSALHAMVMFML